MMAIAVAHDRGVPELVLTKLTDKINRAETIVTGGSEAQGEAERLLAEVTRDIVEYLKYDY